ncbi:MAG: bacillithiol system redox-active protein YtxJ [Balneolaceae bacterium]|nr:bacillithiol system redox-active protein YtxJ [Balneolaceae bacterium]
MFTASDTNLDHWNVVTDKDQVEKVLENSHQKAQLVYKHSHTCGICHAAKEQIESVFTEIEKQADMNFINVKKSRPVSNAFAEQLGVRHESPQVLIINQGKCVWHKSHWSIKADAILNVLD